MSWRIIYSHGTSGNAYAFWYGDSGELECGLVMVRCWHGTIKP